MLDSALIFFREGLNTYLKIKTDGQREEYVYFPEVQLPKDMVMQSNAVSILLLNLEEERLFRSGASDISRRPGEENLTGAKSLCINFHLMFIANFNDYLESLKILSLVIKFFQSYRFFNRQEFPALSADIQQLSTELINLSFMEQSELWRSLEIPCSPFVLYKVRMLIYTDDETTRLDADIESIQLQSIPLQG